MTPLATDYAVSKTKTVNGKLLINIWPSMDNSWQNRKIQKMTKKRSFRIKFNIFLYWMITSKHSFDQN